MTFAVAMTSLASLAMAQQPWDLRRFAKTAFFFNSPEEVLKRVPLPGRRAPTLGVDGELFSSTAARPSLLQFGPLDDVVMGGVSESTFTTDGVFSGVVSTDNNGGFAGCRSKALSPPLQLSSKSGLKMRVRGDSALRRYKAIVRDSYDWNGIAWSQSFDVPPAEWCDVDLPFDQFVPTLFARTVPGGATVDKSQIHTVQLTYSKFEYDSALNPNFEAGPFELQIENIRTY